MRTSGCIDDDVNYNEHADDIAPVQIRTHDELLADSQSV